VEDGGTFWVKIVKNCHILGQQEKMEKKVFSKFNRINLYSLCPTKNLQKTLTPFDNFECVFHDVPKDINLSFKTSEETTKCAF